MAVAPEARRAEPAQAASATAERLFNEHSGWIYGYCLRLLRSPEEAEDALQTTYLNACRSLNGGTRPRAGSAWLLKIAQNVCFARLRSAGRRGKLERAEDVAVLDETVAAPEHSREELIGLVDALASLPDRQRRAILLREWQGLSYNEVAASLGVTQAAVETLIFRARRSLAAALEKPGARRRRRTLHALDVGGLLAAIKGFFAGSVGTKAVATVAVAAATTATVAATDPARVWSDRDPPAAAKPEERHSPGAPAGPTESAVAAVHGGSVSATPSAAAADSTAHRPAHAAREREPASQRGGAMGRSTAAAAKAKAKPKAQDAGGNGNGKGKAKALGHAKEPSAPTSSQGRGVPAGGKPDTAPRPAPPAHAEAKGLAKKAARQSG